MLHKQSACFSAGTDARRRQHKLGARVRARGSAEVTPPLARRSRIGRSSVCFTSIYPLTAPDVQAHACPGGTHDAHPVAHARTQPPALPRTLSRRHSRKACASLAAARLLRWDAYRPTRESTAQAKKRPLNQRLKNSNSMPPPMTRLMTCGSRESLAVSLHASIRRPPLVQRLLRHLSSQPRSNRKRALPLPHCRLRSFSCSFDALLSPKRPPSPPGVGPAIARG